MRVVLESVSKVFAGRGGRRTEALHDVSLTLEEGEFLTGESAKEGG